jgi:ferric iron reductase protein FhuF
MTPSAALTSRSADTSRLRRFLAIDEREALIARAQTPLGQLAIALIAVVAIAAHLGVWQAVLAAAAAMSAVIWTNSRAAILFSATWLMAFAQTASGGNDTLDRITAVLHQEQLPDAAALPLALGWLLLVLLGSAAALQWVRWRPQSMLARRPLITLLVLEALLCCVASLSGVAGLSRAMLWSATFVLTPYLWFLPYAIVDQRSRDPNPALTQLGTLRPFWSPSYLPFGKGAAFLRKSLAKTPAELAVTQLKAVKLLLWANVLFALRDALIWLFNDTLQIPRLGDAIDAFVAGQPYALPVAWAALILSMVKLSLQIAMWAHLFIGIARLAGYRLPRGSWRPLESRTLMDYFNRFHYYFKELLVDFFFVPTFFKVFRNHQRLRMFFATFMAAGVGNALWHFVRDIDLITTLGPVVAVETFSSYLVYSAVLATGVGLSQLRANLGHRPSPTLVGQLYSFFVVWSFVTCLHIFGDASRDHTLGERTSFLASLFGIN